MDRYIPISSFKAVYVIDLLASNTTHMFTLPDELAYLDANPYLK